VSKSKRFQKDTQSGGMVPTQVITNKITAPSADFSGQDSGYPAASPGGEVSQNLDGGVAGVNFQFIPSIDDPAKNQKVTIFQSTDPKLHTDASYRLNEEGDGRGDGTPPVPYGMWPGPHPRGTE